METNTEQALYQPWTQEPETVTGSPLTTEVWLPAPLMTRAPARPTAFHCTSLQYPGGTDRDKPSKGASRDVGIVVNNGWSPAQSRTAPINLFRIELRGYSVETSWTDPPELCWKLLQ